MRATWEEITEFVATQKRLDGAFFDEMRAIRDQYHADIVVPVTSVPNEPSMVAPIPALVADAVDANAMRANSVKPHLFVPSLDASPTAQARASKRKRALYADWHESAMDVLMFGAYRHYTAYGTSNIIVLPNFEKQGVDIEVRDPLGVYPDFRHPLDVQAPRRIAYTFARSVAWIRKRYGAELAIPTTARDGDQWEMVEWIDEHDVVIGVIGPRYSNRYSPTVWPAHGYELRRWPNKANGMVPVAQPHRMTLDRVAGQVASMVPIVNLMAKMTALDIIAAEKAIFGDLVVMSKDGQEPRLVSGAWKDGRTGEANVIAGASEVKVLQQSPGPLTDQVLNRLERAARLHGGNPSLMQGELSGSLRSGQTVNALAGVSVDPRIQEAQTIMARGLTVVNEAILEVRKGYFPNKKVVAFSGWPSDRGVVEFTPATDFDTTFNSVEYAFPGVDANSLTIALGQLVGAGLMSRETARSKHPFINDSEGEERAIVAERLNDAVLESFLQQTASGALPLVDLANILGKFATSGDLVQSIIDAQRDAQERQAAAPPPPEPGQAFSPATQPGLALPGQGAETAAPSPPPPEIGPVRPAMGNFRELLNALSATAG